MIVRQVNDPRNEYYKLYTVDYLGNVVGGVCAGMRSSSALVVLLTV